MFILFFEGVGKGCIDFNCFVVLIVIDLVKMYGFYLCKGIIVIGGDVDIVVWDLYCQVMVSNSMLYYDVDYIFYEGMQLMGWLVFMFLCGEIVWCDGEVLGILGCG